MPALSRRDFLKLSCAAALAACAGGVHARDLLTLRQVELVVRNENHVLTGGYAIQLTPRLEESLRKGVTFSFVQMFEAVRPRDYWFPENIAVLKRTLRLSYNALLQHYQIQRDAHTETHDGLADALEAVGSFADWPVLDNTQINKKRLYRARVRMLLDTSQLPKPLQMNAFASARWDLDSGWREWTFKP
jgi:hypothetical protein